MPKLQTEPLLVIVFGLLGIICLLSHALRYVTGFYTPNYQQQKSTLNQDLH